MGWSQKEGRCEISNEFHLSGSPRVVLSSQLRLIVSSGFYWNIWTKYYGSEPSSKLEWNIFRSNAIRARAYWPFSRQLSLKSQGLKKLPVALGLMDASEIVMYYRIIIKHNIIELHYSICSTDISKMTFQYTNILLIISCYTFVQFARIQYFVHLGCILLGQ